VAGDEEVDAGPRPRYAGTGGDGAVATVEVTPGRTCAECGRTEAVHWHRLVTDWVEYLADSRPVERGGGPTMAPLCEWCHSWAQVLELAELARPHLGRAERIRLAQQRNRFLDGLDAELVSDLATA
jgi:hypothetical protein